MTTIEQDLAQADAELEAARVVSSAASADTQAAYQRRDALVTKVWEARRDAGWQPQSNADWQELTHAAYDNSAAHEYNKTIIRGFDKHLSGHGYMPDLWLPGVQITLKKNAKASGLADGITRLVASFGVDEYPFQIMSYHLSEDGIRQLEYRASDGMARTGMTSWGRPTWDEWQPLDAAIRSVASRWYYPREDRD